MRARYLEVTFRNGKPLAAYLHLPRATGSKSFRTEGAAPGLRIDFSESGAPMGLEITAPGKVTVAQINAVLTKLGLGAIDPAELAPLEAA
jgi:hypothetical protein